MIKDELLHRFKKEIENIVAALKNYNPERIILFGSFANGDVNAHSDIDLCIIKNSSKRFIDRIGDVLQMIDSSFPVEPLVYTAEEFERMRREGNPLIDTIIQQGRVLYEQEPGVE